jgi:lipopolysaccharide export LptBFGC system permease protein LptF
MKVNVRYLGALGFGLGGLVVGLSGDYFIFAIFFMGLIGSAMLSIPARSMKFTILTTFLGAFGFVIGFTNISKPISENIPPALITLIAAAVAGILLGHAALLSRRIRK